MRLVQTFLQNLSTPSVENDRPPQLNEAIQITSLLMQINDSLGYGQTLLYGQGGMVSHVVLADSRVCLKYPIYGHAS